MLVFGKPVVEKKEKVVSQFEKVMSICITKDTEDQSTRAKVIVSMPALETLDLLAIDKDKDYLLSFTGIEKGIFNTLFANVSGVVDKKAAFPINRNRSGFNKELVTILRKYISESVNIPVERLNNEDINIVLDSEYYEGEGIKLFPVIRVNIDNFDFYPTADELPVEPATETQQYTGDGME